MISVAIVGAGSVGCHVGGYLARQASVTLIGRPPLMNAIADDGLTLTKTGSEPRHVSAREFQFANGVGAVAESDFVIVSPKSLHTASVAQSLAEVIKPGAIVVSLQNGMRNGDILKAALPDGVVVLRGMFGYNVSQPEPGTIHQGTLGEIMIEDHPRVRTLVDSMRAGGLSVELRSDIVQVQAGKLLMNLNNAVNALSGLPLREELLDRDYRMVLAKSYAEALKVFKAAGIEPASLTGVPVKQAGLALKAPNAVFTKLAKKMLAVDEKATSSMADDLVRGRLTEVEVLNGEIVALAAQHGLSAPVNARLTELVHEAEQQGPDRQKWSGSDLRAAIK